MLIKKYVIQYVIQDAEIEIEGVTLLSAEEYKRNRTIIPLFPHWWWLRSPGPKYSAENVNTFGYTIYNDANYDSARVRPALKIKNPENLRPGDKIEIADKMWTVLRDGLALCDDSVGCSPFRADWQAEDVNDYEASDVKKFIEKWAEENGLVEGR